MQILLKKYIDIPLDLNIKKYKNQVYKLKSSLYGLKQSPRVLYSKLRKKLILEGFIMSNVDNFLFIKITKF